MDSLSNEMLCSIFDHLSVRSLMTSRMVCKKWKSCVDKAKPKRFVARDSNYNVTRYWYYTYQPVDDDDVIKRIDWFSQCLQKIRLNIEHVTCLIIDTPLPYEDAKLLNRFQQLRHLEFASFIWQEVGPPKIMLPHLKILKINWAVYHDETTIEAPKLEILSCLRGLDRIKIPYHKSVKQLQIGDKQNHLKHFENVEVFSCFKTRSIITDIFDQLPKLKEIHLLDGHYKDKCANFLNFKETEIEMNRLIEQKKSLGKTDVKLHFLGESLDDDSKMFNDYGFHEKFKRVFEA